MFDTFVMVDWSGGTDTGAKRRKDAIWIGVARRGEAATAEYMRNREVAEDALGRLLAEEMAQGRRVMAGFDFPFGYPAGFARAVCGQDDPLALWDWIEARIEDRGGESNRFDLAGEVNRAVGGGAGPFWGNGLKRDIEGLPRRKDRYLNDFPERREVERLAKGAFTCWQMSGAGSVGSQVLTGLPVLARLRRKLGAKVWPFEPLDGAPVALVEIWPSLVLPPRATRDEIPDREQVLRVAERLAAMAPEELGTMLDVQAPEAGWILGVLPDGSTSPALRGLQPPALRDDCFALPAGVDWVPVEEAQARLRASLSAAVGTETVPVGAAAGRIVAAQVRAERANPPGANAAVDGWGFAHGELPAPDAGGRIEMPVAEGRAAAGAPFDGVVPAGKALRILTGALLPEGVDTVVLDEDVVTDGARVAFDRMPKPRANTRKAGEDVAAQDVLFEPGHRLRAPDVALIAATGVAEVQAAGRLRVGVLSTGDEIVEPGAAEGVHQTHDANRPMLLAMAQGWGHEAVDLGRVGDDRDALRAALTGAGVDVILTSGGASAGDEDHLSALLREEGDLTAWRIALKPGRPLALGRWQGVPLFGLPGNPVAALVTAALFARPALEVLAGGHWLEPEGFAVPAAFEKRKKPGRREYLRARMGPEGVEVFASEGSGRISGLSWAGGLVELPDGALEVKRGDPVRFIPYAALGL
ncbi:molybdopterin-binding protein [Vannielia litorea]|uniref:molybdopterin-binding protein n=1 Tax=Vannielia litorea TaxID=1217970 RepID=UPI001C93DF86|nr:molybdopterin-binding protein [Vannielia litorea]MBY6049583.1 molybdopterin molybdenumtransferase MoeA [Vannielia litorea]MBY6076997.1 molybdopterin molybdenumtransferase MoeA [Vannielia litorea]